VNSTGRSSDAVSTNDTITIRNAATGSAGCT
jgi:hypothetical protein